MVSLFRNKFRIRSTRLRGWDYSSPGSYYITICTKNRRCFFGNIISGEMRLSGLGIIIEKYWNEIPKHYKKVSLDRYVVMPNHLHGIITIEENIDPVETPHWGVSTNKRRLGNHRLEWKPNTIGSIICQFKSICTKHIRKSGCSYFDWQSRFYESLIRDYKEMIRIRNYILNNPSNWDLDENNIN